MKKKKKGDARLRRLVMTAMDNAAENGYDDRTELAENVAIDVMDRDAAVEKRLEELSPGDHPAFHDEVTRYVVEWRQKHPQGKEP